MPTSQMNPTKHNSCPRCGNPEVSTMAELLDLVHKPSSQFSSDMVEWLQPPKRPTRPISKRHRTGFRNSVAFGLFWIALIAAGSFALTGNLPSPTLVIVSVVIAILVGISNWRFESRMAVNEDSVLLEAHWERYRAYLQRKRVWARLRYCPRCQVVIDPITFQSATIFEVHELANSKIKQVLLGGNTSNFASAKSGYRKRSK